MFPIFFLKKFHHQVPLQCRTLWRDCSGTRAYQRSVIRSCWWFCGPQILGVKQMFNQYKLGSPPSKGKNTSGSTALGQYFCLNRACPGHSNHSLWPATESWMTLSGTREGVWTCQSSTIAVSSLGSMCQILVEVLTPSFLATSLTMQVGCSSLILLAPPTAT